ncbi:MAG: carbon-nitrogen hydrolase family protein [Candidatus Aureabacteria bacterium]|nr:carbon-nitrogen hydrolase family protein [Candidatus Auribacterota bacterium]
MKTFTAALLQMRGVRDPEANLRAIEEMTDAAVRKGAQFVAGPEFFLCPAEIPLLRQCAAPVPGPVTERLAGVAKRHRIHFVPGTIPERGPGGEIYNTLLFFGPDGALLAKYRKRHLFRVDIPGVVRHDERDYLAAGAMPAPVIDTELGRFGASICYDLRFPEQYLRMALDGAEILLAPSAFISPTGEAHWHLLCRARAVETGCFLLGPNRTGRSGDEPERYGHSLVVDPWGRVLADGGEDEGVMVAKLSAAALAEARQRLDNIHHRISGDPLENVL